MTRPIPYDQRLARVLVRPLARTPLTPNQLTAVTLLLALLGAGLMATGEESGLAWGSGLFVLARFLDHFDGELARLTGQTSRFGYYFDYVAGALSYAALFAAMGIGLDAGALSGWAPLLGAAGALSALVSMPLNLGIDSMREETRADAADAVGYPAFAGFELEDAMYLLAPITWLGLLPGFFVLAGSGASVYLLWTGFSLLRARRQARSGGARVDAQDQRG